MDVKYFYLEWRVSMNKMKNLSEYKKYYFAKHSDSDWSVVRIKIPLKTLKDALDQVE